VCLRCERRRFDSIPSLPLFFPLSFSLYLSPSPSLSLSPHTHSLTLTLLALLTLHASSLALIPPKGVVLSEANRISDLGDQNGGSKWKSEC